MKKLFLLASFTIMGNALSAKWDAGNNPNYFNNVAKNPMNMSFRDLPLEARLQDDRLGWSETFWPSKLGGIAYRWNHPNPMPFQYRLFKKDEIKRMSEAELAQLSPAELYDIAMGDYGFPLTKKVLKKYSPDDLWWEGICHGWAQAASNYPEPDKNVVINKDGIRVPFGSSDVKALLAMHDAYNSQGNYARLGQRCGVKGKVPGEAFPEDGDLPFPSREDAELPECADVNAGAFHVVLTNMIGLNSQGFVADVDRFNDIWNQPVTSYQSNVVGEELLTSQDQRNGVDKKIRIKTQMFYGDELEFMSPKTIAEGVIGFVSKDPVTGTTAQTIGDKKYEYILELNQDGEIIGGTWISESRPDMIWMKTRDREFRDGKFDLRGLKLIYKPVRR